MRLWSKAFGWCVAYCLCFSPATINAAQTQWQAGVAKVDITPKEPVRMSGYGNRDHPNEGIATPLFARAICLRATTGQTMDVPLVLVSVDNIGLSGATSRALAATIESRHSIPRSRVVFCSTHTHCAPDLGGQLSNIFATPLTPAEQDATQRYAALLDDGILQAVALAIKDLKPATLGYGVGTAPFAANRRVLNNGKWSGFGVQDDGPVDHSVPVLKVSTPEGAVRGLIFNYACHCTTLGGDYYQINADWAGYATTQLEQSFPDSVALCTIGCGADANPNPRGTEQFAQMHGQTLANEVRRVIATQLQTIDSKVEAHFDYAALSFDLPTREELEERLGDSNPQLRRHAERMIKEYHDKGRLPATYPVPIQSWKFGDQLSMIFLGGEVVVDYALRLKRVFNDPNLWVSAYSNDVLGYIASERMREEGGYEYDRSGIYYSLPGPWASGSEDLLIERVENLRNHAGRPEPLDVDAALKSIQVADKYVVELVASEPLVTDPVNMAFGDDGRLWVVEMGDYPEGTNGGRIKTLTDSDGDGVFDKATTFLADVPFPTGVQPYEDGVLISAAPDLLFARDTNGDDKADQVDSIYSGFRLANPQHRVNGFSYGLDHSFHLASGDNLGELVSTKTGETVNASGHDVQIWPGSGRIAVTSGRTQFVRSRDSFGRWFGNNNSMPMFHFPIDDAYLKRNPAVSFSSNTQQLFTPPVAPPVFPLTSAAERFNDLFAANRFTSACSSIISLSPYFDENAAMTAFICEPVHNLVHRAVLSPHGSTFQAERLPTEQNREFLASTDPWFRPVRALIGPDGLLYIVDMYREVIEHPEWIPDAWQQRLNLRAGEQRGRIYRVRPVSVDVTPIPKLNEATDLALLEYLRSPIGPLRDQAQRLLIQRDVTRVEEQLLAMARTDSSPFARIHALSILDVIGALEPSLIVHALTDSDPGVLVVAIRLCEAQLDQSAQIRERLSDLAEHQDPAVAMQVALALGQTNASDAGQTLAKLAIRPDLDHWLSDAIVSSARHHAEAISEAILTQTAKQSETLTEVKVHLLGRALATASQQGTQIEVLAAKNLSKPDLGIDARLQLAECFIGAARQSSSNISSLAAVLRPLQESAEKIAGDAEQTESSRCRAVSLISLNLDVGDAKSEFLLSLLQPATPFSVQCEVIEALVAQGDAQIRESLIGKWPTFSVSVRNHLISQMLSDRQSTEAILNALQDQTIRVNDLSLTAREQLTKTGTRSMRVQAERILRSAGSKERGAVVREILAQFSALRRSDDTSNEDDEIELGRMLFAKHCGVCHSPDPSGIAIGASLDNLTNRSDEALLESILDPNRSIEPKFQSYVVQTDEGRTLAGVIESEIADSLTIAHADGKKTTVRRDQIEQLRNTGVSLMPEGFETTLQVKELRAIVRFLQR